MVADTWTMGRMRLRMRVHHLPGDNSLQRILMPVAPLYRTHITKVLWHNSGALIGSRADLLRLGALFRLAAISPHSVVYLPLRGNAQSEAVTYWAGVQGLADLVIARSEASLRPSAWPTLRTRLRRGPKAGVVTTMWTPAPRPQPDGRRATGDGRLRMEALPVARVGARRHAAAVRLRLDLAQCGRRTDLVRQSGRNPPFRRPRTPQPVQWPRTSCRSS
jgi:hypothetical protein